MVNTFLLFLIIRDSIKESNAAEMSSPMGAVFARSSGTKTRYEAFHGKDSLKFCILKS